MMPAQSHRVTNPPPPQTSSLPGVGPQTSRSRDSPAPLGPAHVPDPTESVSLIRRRLERVSVCNSRPPGARPTRTQSLPRITSRQGCPLLWAPRPPHFRGESEGTPSSGPERPGMRSADSPSAGYSSVAWEEAASGGGARTRGRDRLYPRSSTSLGGRGETEPGEINGACGVIASGSYPGRQTQHVPSLPRISPKSSSEATVCSRLCRDPAVSLRWAGRCSRWGQRQSRLRPCRVGVCPQPPVVVPVSVW